MIDAITLLDLSGYHDLISTTQTGCQGAKPHNCAESFGGEKSNLIQWPVSVESYHNDNNLFWTF